MADESALVFIAPGDSVDEILQKIRGSGAKTVELLVPDGTLALQALGGFEKLRKSLELDRINLLVISSDEKTLKAAREGKVDTVGVQGARVPPPPPSIAERYTTTVLPTKKSDSDEDKFFSALDQVPQDRYAGEDDADLYAALDDLSDAFQASPVKPRTEEPKAARNTPLTADEEFAAALDDWSLDEAPSTRRSTPASTASATTTAWEPSTDYSSEPAPRRRVRAEDLELDSDDLRRQPRDRRAPAASASSSRASSRAEARANTRAEARADYRPEARRTSWDGSSYTRPRTINWPLWGAFFVIAILLLGMIWWAIANRTTVTVSLPGASVSEHNFTEYTVPIADGLSGQISEDAINAVAIEADAEYTVIGTVLEETLSPTGFARGPIRIVNRIGQEIALPAETQFIAFKADGQEVRFTLEQPVIVPAATVTESFEGTTTAFGSVDTTIVALSPGSASNIGPNEILQILLPGQEPITNNTGNFSFVNEAITGGEEQPQRIVTEADVMRELQDALNGLYNMGLTNLFSQIDTTRQALATGDITPSQDELGHPDNYEIIVEPAVGQLVDPNNPQFSILLRAHFVALATPTQQSVGTQLENKVAYPHLQAIAAENCRSNESFAPQNSTVSAYRWDGQRLTIDGTVTCSTKQEPSADLNNIVKQAVAGKSYEEAVASLELLQADGQISGYQIDAKRKSFPSYDFLLNVKVADGLVNNQQPTTTETN